jgi:membrane associated rhomboid family serine protease
MKRKFLKIIIVCQYLCFHIFYFNNRTFIWFQAQNTQSVWEKSLSPTVSLNDPVPLPKVHYYPLVNISKDILFTYKLLQNAFSYPFSHTGILHKIFKIIPVLYKLFLIIRNEGQLPMDTKYLCQLLSPELLLLQYQM